MLVSHRGTSCWPWLDPSPILFNTPPTFTPFLQKMRFYTSQVLAAVLATISVVDAHVNVVYPALRGPDVSKDQVLFCGQ